MARLYSSQILSTAGLNAGSSVNVLITVPEAEFIVIRIRAVSVYFGSVSPVSANSFVVLDTRATSIPTVYAYDSGVTGSITPIYARFDGIYTLAQISGPVASDEILRVVNTSAAPASICDVTISGDVLTGQTGVEWGYS